MRWRRRPEELLELIGLQDELMDAAAPLVRPKGGVLVYSTCSVEPEECIERVRAFLLRHPEFQLQDLADLSSHPNSSQLKGRGKVFSATAHSLVATADGCFATFPHIHGCDGAFAARMIRQ
jgi:16S rRNA (cytosine967-C5)-methyltransferase